ncbi:TPA: CPBP family intramembrane metalloprotease [Candidatus Woesearchaeota archaeon]|nr:CPBP family intramembrane metalloprotease [Candidatus Woesearchaeota archaeon]
MRSIFEQKYFHTLHRAFLKKNPDKLLAMGAKVLKRRLGADEVVLHLARVAVDGILIYTHDPKNRSLDIYEQEHIEMVPNYVNDFYSKNLSKPEILKADHRFVVLVPLVTRHEEHIGVMEIKCKGCRKLGKLELEEIDYYAEAFVSIIDDYRKQKEHIGYMRDITGLVILLVMWTLFFMSISIIYSFSPEHYNVIFFIVLFFIVSGLFIIFEEHLYTLKGWGIDIPDFIRNIPFYIGISVIVVVASGLFKWFGMFGIKPDLGGGFLVFNWTWRDIFYPITVPLQEMASRALPHTILRHVLKGWHKNLTIVMVSSLVFAFGHISFGLGVVILTFLLGVILGAVFEWKRNLWGVCLIHMIVGYLVMTGLGYDLAAMG